MEKMYFLLYSDVYPSDTAS